MITYGEDYSGQPIGEGITAREGMEQPVNGWVPSIAISGMTFYTGDKLPNDEILSASMVAYVLEKFGVEDIRIVDGRITEVFGCGTAAETPHAARAFGRRALLVTGSGGLSLLAGLVLAACRLPHVPHR